MATKSKTSAQISDFPRLKQLYQEKLRAEIKSELGLSNINEVPKLQKVIVNIGVGRAKDDKRFIDTATNTLRKVTGQQPIQTKAKKSIATFKLREGNVIGLKATLRGDRMYEFTDRLISLVLPRLRDFHGVSNQAFDKSGNFSIGLSDQSVFPELSFEETTTSHGLQAVFVIDSVKPEHSKVLLEKLGMPFEKVKENK
ncbi:MAG TPA: 50S ribosomal protein L5 [Candidatus Saccharimonadales bacterium]|nr:50S ribosomal protein L5 [Candidatus Saccharimonadales bacterium]